MTINAVTTSNNLHRMIATAIFGALASGAAVCTAADSTEEIRSETVATSEAASVHRLYLDLKGAAARTCASVSAGSRDELAAKKCAKDALAKAVADAHQPALTAEWEANK